MLYIRRLIEICGDEDPMIVLAIAPPYYPAVCNAYLAEDGRQLTEQVREVVEEDYQLRLSVVPYFTGIGDASYLSCTDPAAQRKLLSNLTLPAAIYDIPFEAAAQLGMPTFFWARAVVKSINGANACICRIWNILYRTSSTASSAFHPRKNKNRTCSFVFSLYFSWRERIILL